MTSPDAPPADPTPGRPVGAPVNDHSGEYSHRQILTILSGLVLGMFLAALDQTIVSTSIRTIADDLNGLSLQAWATTAYLITSTIATPIYGKLGDLFGRKRLFLFAITIFMVGSLASSFSTTMYMLAGFRALQGIGAGGLFTLALAIIGDIVAPRERARYTGYFMAVFATSSVLGPVIGGLFAQAHSIFGITGWRWVFLVNVPIGLAALFVVTRTLQLDHDHRKSKVDWRGAALLVVGLVPLLTVAEQGRGWGWGSGRSLACFVVGAIGLVLFVLNELRRGDMALIPPRIFRIRAASVTIAASVIVGMAMFGGMMTLPLYMQIVHGASPMKSGFLMLPMVLGMMSAAIVSGQITSRTGKIRIFPIIGSAIVTVGLLLLSTINADTPLWHVEGFMLVLGLGLGNCMQPLMLIVQSSVPPREIGVATSSATFFRQIGGTVGVATFLSLLFSTVGDNIRSAFTTAIASGTIPVSAMHTLVANGTLARVKNDSSVINTLPAAIAHPFKVGFADSISQVFLLAGGVAVLAFLVLLLMPKIELRSTSAAAATRAEAATAS